MSFIQKIKDLFAVSDDEAFEEDDSYDEPVKTEPEKKNTFKPTNISPASRSNNYDVTRNKYESADDYQGGYSPRQSSIYNAAAYIDKGTNTKSLKLFRDGQDKYIPIQTTARGNEICIMKPFSFNDSQDICDVLLSQRAAVVNLEGLDMNLAQRIIDFLSGTVYAIKGKLFYISGNIYIFSPSNVDISGDYDEIAQQSGFDIPTLTM